MRFWEDPPGAWIHHTDRDLGVWHAHSDEAVDDRQKKEGLQEVVWVAEHS